MGASITPICGFKIGGAVCDVSAFGLMCNTRHGLLIKEVLELYSPQLKSQPQSKSW